MASELIQVRPNGCFLSPQQEYFEPHWYAIYTASNCEQRVATQLDRRSVGRFLPTYQTVSRWKDRTVKLERPLFPGYTSS